MDSKQNFSPLLTWDLWGLVQFTHRGHPEYTGTTADGGHLTFDLGPYLQRLAKGENLCAEGGILMHGSLLLLPLIISLFQSLGQLAVKPTNTHAREKPGIFKQPESVALNINVLYVNETDLLCFLSSS